MIMMMGVDLSNANLEGIKYDKFSLQNILNCKLNKTRMSEDLKNDLESLRAIVIEAIWSYMMQMIMRYFTSYSPDIGNLRW